MNLQTERIGQFCKQLKLERVAAEYAAAAQSAVRDEASFTDFLETVLKAESDYRAERTRQLAKLAGLPTVKTLEAFDFGDPGRQLPPEGQAKSGGDQENRNRKLTHAEGGG